MLAYKLSMCSETVKLYLEHFAHLWCCYNKNNMQGLNIADNDDIRLLLKPPRWCSTSQMFVNVNLLCCNMKSYVQMYVQAFTKWYYCGVDQL